ncbi:flavin-containing monooxygenase [Tepidamorphus sp. 3E244]|uniref:flavin-containing monooxygenase n=1 Tax=Tepidamorphus sp. 3E244 TaxID=3385498 RepID=UPI0038FC794F
MSIETTHTLVVGAGQAGIAMSEHLRADGIEHVVLEKDRVAESWRTARWDSLVANGPAWHDRFPNLEYPKSGPDEFPPKEEVVDYFTHYAQRIDAPIRTGVEVTSCERLHGRPGFRVETSLGALEVRNVVAATGAFQVPVIPKLVPEDTDIAQLHSHDYRNPDQLGEGAVLVVGAGSSGTQIADELNRAGRTVYLSIGPHDRPPRAYRGRDNVWWLGVLGKWDAATPPGGAEHVTIAVSGARGGETIDFRRMAGHGITLLGRTDRFEDGVMHFNPDLATNIARGDANYLSLLDEADAYVLRNELDLPEEIEAREIGPDPDCMTKQILELDLAEAGIGTILWATGYENDYGWLKVDNALDEAGRPNHRRGVSEEPGIYFLGLPWQSRRGSSFIWGVWHDAKYISDHIAKLDGYLSYRPTAHGDSE